MRDARGRFIDRRSREYRLVFTTAEPETVFGLTPSVAVASRTTPERPHTITDMTTLRMFRGQRAYGHLMREPEPEPVMATTWLERMARR